MHDVPTGRNSADIRDGEGFAAIDDYAVIGDGRGVALVAADARVDWWAVPRLDSPPPFAALLDPERGGHVELAPTEQNAACSRRYRPHTNVLETVFTTSKGSVRITDSLNSGSAGALPWGELARRVEGVEGSVELAFSACPGDGLRGWEPWAETDDRGVLLHAGTITMGVRCSPEIRLTTSTNHVEATFTVRTGERRVLALVAADNDPVYLSDIGSIDHRIEVTAESWRTWCTQVEWDGPGRERIVRSALALKLLVIAQTGAVAAAATTSLPESVGGPKNWDYRLSWIRDAALTIDALARLGLQEEVHAAVTWLLRAIRRHGQDVHALFTLDGDLPNGVQQPDLPGYRHSRPVMIGNAAAGQTQLGAYGDLFGTVADWVFSGHVLDTGSARMLADLADRCADVWRRDDAGIWELSDYRPYTISKINCWRALDAAARLAEAGQLSGSGARWRAEAAMVRTWIEKHCWSATKQAYTFYAGTDELDASVLLAAGFGFDTGSRMSSTVDAVGTELGAGPLLYRYSGAQREEETFIACAFWRVHALAALGRITEARDLLTALDIVPNELGLMSEMSVPGDAGAMGNLPQALSHLAHIRAAHALRAAEADVP